MRFLLDENIDPGIELVLRGLGQQADHISNIGARGADDFRVLSMAAARYDVLVTLDLHRQEREFLASMRAILDGLNILRIRLPRPSVINVGHVILVARQLIMRMPDWMIEFQRRAVLITVGPQPGALRVLDRLQVAAILKDARA